MAEHPDKAKTDALRATLPPGQKQSDGRTRIMLHIPAVKPYVTYAILTAYILVCLPMLVRPETADVIFAAAALERYQVLTVGEYHRLFTALFLHVNLAHLIINAVTLYLFGANMERIFGHPRFALIYGLGGTAGAVVSVLLMRPEMYSVATSGAVAAVLATEFVYLYRHRKLLGKRGWRRRWWVALFTALVCAAGLGSSLLTPTINENWSLLGGLLGGGVLAVLIAPIFNLRRHPTYSDALITEDINPLTRRWAAVSIYSAALLAVLLVGVLTMR